MVHGGDVGPLRQLHLTLAPFLGHVLATHGSMATRSMLLMHELDWLPYAGQHLHCWIHPSSAASFCFCFLHLLPQGPAMCQSLLTTNEDTAATCCKHLSTRCCAACFAYGCAAATHTRMRWAQPAQAPSAITLHAPTCKYAATPGPMFRTPPPPHPFHTCSASAACGWW